MSTAFDNLESYNLDAEHQGLANLDINYPDKDRGYISLQPIGFSFIGPDRHAIDTYDLDLYLKVAGTVKHSGVPNYRQVRIPIKSRLNIQAWQLNLTDCNDRYWFNVFSMASHFLLGTLLT